MVNCGVEVKNLVGIGSEKVKGDVILLEPVYFVNANLVLNVNRVYRCIIQGKQNEHKNPVIFTAF